LAEDDIIKFAALVV